MVSRDDVGAAVYNRFLNLEIEQESKIIINRYNNNNNKK